jgi:tetratricopeptide (TPR) repeat protein
MDPLTRAAQKFARQLADDWRRDPVVRLVAVPQHRAYLIKSLRLFEWAPENHWPLSIIEVAVDDPGALAEAAIVQVRADIARLRQGLADDGVTLADPAALLTERAPEPDAMIRLRDFVDRAGAALARTGVVAGLALAFVPAAPSAPKALRRLAASLAVWPRRAHVRLALAVPKPDELAELLPVGTGFELDDAALHDYCRQQGERQAAAAPPAEASLRRHFLAASDAAQRGDLAAAQRAYLAASAELESQHRLAEAAVVHITLGGLAFGLKDDPAALGHFDRAVSYATTSEQPAVLAQAQLGAAGVLFSRGDLENAAPHYELAARSGGPDALRIEALRMAGTCRFQLGDREAAARAWHAAVTDASALPAATRGQTTWKQAGEALLAHLQRKGQTTQADHIRALLQAD